MRPCSFTAIPLGLSLALLPACQPEAPEVDPPAPTLRRLTQAQYTNAVTDLFTPEVLVTDRLEPDQQADGLLEIGASITTISPRGVELYEGSAFELVTEVMANDAMRDNLVPCSPAAVTDSACAEETIARFGKRAWRRPLLAEEVDAWVNVADTASGTLGDFYEGLGYAIAGILQSPNFLYRVELGEPDPERPGGYRYTDWEMAERVSFLVWNSIPDEELLAAAEAGELTGRDGLLIQVERMLESPRARDGMRAFFDDYLALYEAQHLSKDPFMFNHWAPEVGPAAREETLMLFEDWVFDTRGDYRDLMTTRRSWVNPQLAALYNVRSPSREGFELVEFAPEDQRAGLIGHASLLATYAHPTSSSPTLRGKFIRERLLCQPLPPPPAGLNTAIPEADTDLPTMRDRLTSHMEDPACASCHAFTDPIGLGLENYDGIGRYRQTDNDVPIDASGDFGDGDKPFTDPIELGRQLRNHDSLTDCFSTSLYRYATGHVEVLGEADAVIALGDDFRRSRYRVAELLVDTALSNGFRKTGAIQ